MTSNAFTLLQLFFNQVFRFFTEITVPGTNMRFAQLLFFVALVPLVLHFLVRLLGSSSGINSITPRSSKQKTK